MRRVDWELAEAHEDGDDVVLAFRLADTSATRSSAWPHRFDARYTVTVGSRLTLSLQVTNLDPGTVTVEEAFHTYLRVADIHATEVTGLEGAETDRIDLGTRAAATVVDGAARRSVTIAKDGSRRTVVPNAWGAKSAVLATTDWPAPPGHAHPDNQMPSDLGRPALRRTERPDREGI